VLTVARLESQKDHATLIEAVPRVPDARFVLVGEGGERRALESRARALGVSDRVRFLGLRGDIADLLAISDVFVLPSLYEGLPLSILEAMAAGKPVVASSIPGIDEVVVDGETGLLVPPRDPAALAASIRLLLTDSDLRVRLGDAGRERVHGTFSLERMVEGVVAVYQEALAEHPD
jgi:glycosyltransferase involved in cell wall biosynthesis